VPESAVTHKAIKNGSWFDPNTWANKKVPGASANVMIAKGVSVTYDQESDAVLKTVRVDGTLSFATNKDTKMVVDTFVNAPLGTLNIGTSNNNRVQSDKTAKILIAGQGNINTKWDPTQLSRGVLSHGKVNIYGANKDEFLTLQQDAKAGDDQLVLKAPPKGWGVGDKLVLGGTQYNQFGSDKDNSRFGDEELTITKITGNRISFTNNDIKSGNRNVLRFDHTRPDIAEKGQLKLYVANTTRNVSVETKDADSLPLQQRGHVMFMHNPNVRVENAGFYNLGRSDKSKLVDDPRKNIDGSKGSGKNPRGRYAFHFHRTGAEDINGQQAISRGNAVVGSPGWGMVHHDSNAILENNVVYDVVGAGITAESGNELGRWSNNLTIKTTGYGKPVTSAEERTRKKKFDFGIEGEGYWVQGAAQVAMDDNIAISANSAGITLFGDGQGDEARDAKTILVKNLPSWIQALFPPGTKEVDITDVPLNQLKGFQSYNTRIGINAWSQLANFDGELDLNNRNPNATHEGRSTIEDFTVWGTRVKGINSAYSSSIDFVNGLLVGDIDKPIGNGISHNHATHKNRYIGLNVQGYEEGYEVQFPNRIKNTLAHSIEDSSFSNNIYNLQKIGEDKATKDSLDDISPVLKIDNTSFQSAKNNKAPTAQFASTSAGGLSVTFDASESYDSDKTRYPIPSQGIASYGWDFNNDGKIDQFGRTVTHHFNKAGNQKVSVKVLDNQGAATTLSKTINISPTAYLNPFVDADFGNNTQFRKSRQVTSQLAPAGWQSTNNVRVSGSTALLSSPKDRQSGIAQVIQNDGLHRGKQTLSFDLKNIEGSKDKIRRNEVTVQLWGVNGQFDGHITEGSGPTQAGTTPLDRTQLFSQTYGGASGQFFDWKTIDTTVDLGSKGYQYLVAQVKTNRTDSKGDSVAIDNFSLSTDGETPGPIDGDPEPVDPEPVDPEPVDPSPDSIDLHKLPSWIAQFNFNEERDKLARDTSKFGAKHVGKLKGSATWGAGLAGNAIALNGNSDSVHVS
ncbi:MAG: G8 domain-containing protein, partial [Cyanobacteria bacterium J06607_17]